MAGLLGFLPASDVNIQKIVLPPFPELPPGENAGELVMEPNGKHTHTVILMHSVKGAAEMFSRLYLRFGGFSEGFKFVFPRAPQRTAFVPSTGYEISNHSWFQASARREDGSVDTSYLNREELATQTTRLHAIIEREAIYLGGDCSKIILGGIAQGGAFAIHAAMPPYIDALMHAYTYTVSCYRCMHVYTHVHRGLERIHIHTSLPTNRHRH